MRPRERAGLAIPDILVALLVAAFAILPLMNLNAISRRRGQQGEAHAKAALEAEQMLNHFARSRGYDELVGGRPGGFDDVLGPKHELVTAAIAGGAALESSARDVRRSVRVRRWEPGGVVRITTTIQWRSTAPERELSFVCDRLVSDPRASTRVLAPLQAPPEKESCGP